MSGPTQLPYDLPTVSSEDQFMGKPITELGRDDLLRVIRCLADHNQQLQDEAVSTGKRFSDYIKGHQ